VVSTLVLLYCVHARFPATSSSSRNRHASSGLVTIATALAQAPGQEI
jgi:hypothetical protein